VSFLEVYFYVLFKENCDGRVGTSLLVFSIENVFRPSSHKMGNDPPHLGRILQHMGMFFFCCFASIYNSSYKILIAVCSSFIFTQKWGNEYPIQPLSSGSRSYPCIHFSDINRLAALFFSAFNTFFSAAACLIASSKKRRRRHLLDLRRFSAAGLRFKWVLIGRCRLFFLIHRHPFVFLALEAFFALPLAFFFGMVLQLQLIKRYLFRKEHTRCEKLLFA
jgi:hypothetical protein